MQRQLGELQPLLKAKAAAAQQLLAQASRWVHV
jgi:hypothetical protein